MTPDVAQSLTIDSQVSNQLDEWRIAVDDYLQTVFQKETTAELSGLVSAIEYSLLAPGKRIRPLLVIAAAECAGAAIDSVLPVAVAFEMIHAYSLVHDDLPAMDDDDLRRGLPTSHKQFGEATAILVGDALQAQAFASITQAAADSVIEADSALQILAVLSSCAGWTGMVGGQYLDVQEAHPDRDLNSLRTVHDLKTGALICGAIECGAIAAGLSGTELANFSRFGTELGWLFQLVDDLLDATAEVGSFGKNVGKDRENNRVTGVDILGVDGLRHAVSQQLDQCLLIASELPNGGDALRGIAQLIVQRVLR